VELEDQADQCGRELLDLAPGGVKFTVVIARGAPADLAERGQGGLAGIGQGVRVPLRGRDLRVPQPLLQDLEIRAADKQRRGGWDAPRSRHPPAPFAVIGGVPRPAVLARRRREKPMGAAFPVTGF
jgi:hypothetical protein